MKGSSCRAVAASEYTQVMDVWLTILADWKNEERKKKIAVREKNKTISKRRKEEKGNARTQERNFQSKGPFRRYLSLRKYGGQGFYLTEENS